MTEWTRVKMWLNIEQVPSTLPISCRKLEWFEKGKNEKRIANPILRWRFDFLLFHRIVCLQQWLWNGNRYTQRTIHWHSAFRCGAKTIASGNISEGGFNFEQFMLRCAANRWRAQLFTWMFGFASSRWKSNQKNSFYFIFFFSWIQHFLVRCSFNALRIKKKQNVRGEFID